MTESSISLSQIKKRAAFAFITLMGRKLVLRAISFITINIILARLLPVETLGIFNIATAVITFFAFFSDIGLAGALIQKKESIASEDIKTTFTIQQLLVGSLSIIIFFSSPFLADFYKLDINGMWLIRVLAISFFLSSLKVVPSVLLERDLRFTPLVTVEIVETFVFNTLLIILVIQGAGVWSFSYAALARGISGTLLIYILNPTKIGLGFSKESLKGLLSFGIPFQLNSLLALLKDRLVPLVIARMVTPAEFAYVTWSQAMALLSLDVLSEVNRITFPLFSRVQEKRESLGKALEEALFTACLIIYPLLFGLSAIMPSFINIVVTQKFQPALLSFYLFAFSAYWAVISTVFTNTLNAVGRIKDTLKLMIMWTTLTWILSPLFVSVFGFIGVALASFIISFTSIITIILVKRFLTIRVLDAVLLPTISSALMGLSVYIFSITFVHDKWSLLASILLGAVIYGGLIFLFGRQRILKNLRSLKGD